ncbi:MAG TPA: YggS family pyridoxal phosphate-dependent enzyme [Pseudomonadales bacterium]|nr:YggS family pyridoxal phosphate-dependent enzyme [Pseudomonadales bacterium]
MTTIPVNIAKVQHRIQQAATKSRRDVSDITLMAVSKTQSANAIAEAHLQGGLQHFGENYAQEAEDKLVTLKHLPLIWHFIGPLQSNKTRLVAEQFHWCHSLNRLKIAERLQEQRLVGLPPLNVCVQINIDDEQSKSGLALTEVPALIHALQKMDRLAVRGLMVIPKADQPAAATLASFQRTAACLQALQQQFPALALDTLSMGMSADLELAIEAGSTMVRIGTDIFGKRL